MSSPQIRHDHKWNVLFGILKLWQCRNERIFQGATACSKEITSKILGMAEATQLGSNNFKLVNNNTNSGNIPSQIVWTPPPLAGKNKIVIGPFVIEEAVLLVGMSFGMIRVVWWQV